MERREGNLLKFTGLFFFFLSKESIKMAPIWATFILMKCSENGHLI